MSKGRVVAIYHKESRKVLGYIPCEFITKQTKGYRPVFKTRCAVAAWGNTIQINYDVVHDTKGNPIKVIATSQGDADILIRSQGLTWEEKTAAMLNEPNPILEGLGV